MPDSNIEVRETLPLPLRPIPWKLTFKIASRFQGKLFRKHVDSADPANTICYFWPNTPSELVIYAKSRGILTVREMINTCRETAKKILDEAYAELGLKPNHTITESSVDLERQELSLYDYIFASNQQVAQSLIDIGVAAERILATSFGVTRTGVSVRQPRDEPNSLTVLFVGTACVRKGLPQLLEAWAKSRIRGQLIVAGKVEKALRPMTDRYRLKYNVKFLNFVSNVAALYDSADFFVLPTFEEGGPLVIYEAAAAGLPVITTPIGSARLVKDGVNGLIVRPGDVEGLSNALTKMASSNLIRTGFSRQILRDAADFTYNKVGERRVNMLVKLHTRAKMQKISS